MNREDQLILIVLAAGIFLGLVVGRNMGMLTAFMLPGAALQVDSVQSFFLGIFTGPWVRNWFSGLGNWFKTTGVSGLAGIQNWWYKG